MTHLPPVPLALEYSGSQMPPPNPRIVSHAGGCVPPGHPHQGLPLPHMGPAHVSHISFHSLYCASEIKGNVSSTGIPQQVSDFSYQRCHCNIGNTNRVSPGRWLWSGPLFSRKVFCGHGGQRGPPKVGTPPLSLLGSALKTRTLALTLLPPASSTQHPHCTKNFSQIRASHTWLPITGTAGGQGDKGPEQKPRMNPVPAGQRNQLRSCKGRSVPSTKVQNDGAAKVQPQWQTFLPTGLERQMEETW